MGLLKSIVLGETDVKAILKGVKTAHCMLLRPQPEFRPGEYGHPEELDDDHWCMQIDGNSDLGTKYKVIWDFNFPPPYYRGDKLYVREPWFKDCNRYLYRANYSTNETFVRNGQPIQIPWESGVTMPKEAARLFLKITNVRLVAIQDLTDKDAYRLGIVKVHNDTFDYDVWVVDPEDKTGLLNGVCWTEGAIQAFLWGKWNKSLKPAERDAFCWQKNPYVWMFEFNAAIER